MPLGGLVTTAAIGLGTAAVKAGVQAHRANKDRKRGKALLDSAVRPDMQLTEEAKESLQDARQRAGSTRLDGQNYKENNIFANAGRTTKAITETGGSTGEVISGLGKVQDSTNNSLNQLNELGTEQNNYNHAALRGELEKVSNNKKEIFDYNKNQPYQTQVMRGQAKIGASRQEGMNALDTLTDGANNAATTMVAGNSLKNNDDEEWIRKFRRINQ